MSTEATYALQKLEYNVKDWLSTELVRKEIDLPHLKDNSQRINPDSILAYLKKEKESQNKQTPWITLYKTSLKKIEKYTKQECLNHFQVNSDINLKERSEQFLKQLKVFDSEKEQFTKSLLEVKDLLKKAKKTKNDKIIKLLFLARKELTNLLKSEYSERRRLLILNEIKFDTKDWMHLKKDCISFLKHQIAYHKEDLKKETIKKEKALEFYSALFDFLNNN